MNLVVDLEATCWEVEKVPDLNEIIDIGIVVCDYSFNTVDSWSSLVRPKINPVLSPFCKKLTRIKQNEIDSAPLFDDVIKTFNEWFNAKYQISASSTLWWTWGRWDKKCLTADCIRNNIQFPFGEHRDLKKEYVMRKNNGNEQNCSVKDVLIKESLWDNEVLHRGLQDAIAATKIAKFIFNQNSPEL